MNMINADNYKYSEVTEKIINAFFKSYNTLGYGFLEKVYENALLIDLIEMGLFVEKQKQLKVYYEDKEVGLLLNFGKKPEFKRKVFSNKKNLI